jgi:uncharacterized protein (DUF362 family)/Pyruvate/2-oxoacid:ferredoxin oxidoreductase delta subunit
MTSTVGVVHCPSYDRRMITEAVRQVLGLIGGLGSIVKKGDRVLIKPNLLSAKTPERAITTHPEVVAAVVKAVQEAGGHAVIGDSPGSTRGTLERIWSDTGMQEVADRTGARLENFEAGGSLRRSLNGQVYYISKAVLSADVIVNLPKLKTHSLVLFTGAVKNMFGVVPGFRKRETHLIHPRAEPFSQALVDIFSLSMPQLTLMDAVEGMDGNGPAAGRKRPVGMLLAGSDAVAVDAVAGWAVGIRPKEISTCRLAAQQGLGVAELKEIHVVGDDVRDLNIESFTRPRSDLTRLVPTPLVHLLRRFIYTRPRILLQKCTNCNTCVEVCPTGAMTADQPHPQFQSRKCIGCLCCHELCPESAIDLKWSLLARMVP